MSDFLDADKVDSLWPEWLELYSSLQYDFNEPSAAPFWSAASPASVNSNSRFMLVGRATAGQYSREAFIASLGDSPQTALVERKELNRHFVVHHPKRSSFWRAFVKGSELCGSSKVHENAVWTNLAKIGYEERDVDKALFSRQAGLSERTLIAELSDYKPTLVHFAVGTLGGESILRATGSKVTDWERFDGELNNIWWLTTKDCKMLWTRHPNRAKPTVVNAWNRKLEELASSAR